MAVYTDVSDEEIESFLGQYDIGRLRAFKGIAEGVENSNFLLHTERGFFILTIFEKRVAPAELPFFVGLMDHLAARKFPCPRPLHGKDGAALRRLAGKPAAIVTFLDGVWVRRPSPAHCRALGRAMARMHLATADFALSRPNALGLGAWAPLLAACGERAGEVDPAIAPLLEDELAFLAAHWPQGLPEGVIHADLFPDNVFFVRDRLSGFIDFYFACNDQLAYDLAVALNAWCFEPDGMLNVTKARALVSGYRAVRALLPAEIEALPVLARGAAIRFLLTRLFDWIHRVEGSFVRPKDPLEYVRKLKFHRQAASSAAYGIEPARGQA